MYVLVDDNGFPRRRDLVPRPHLHKAVDRPLAALRARVPQAEPDTPAADLGKAQTCGADSRHTSDSAHHWPVSCGSAKGMPCDWKWRHGVDGFTVFFLLHSLPRGQVGGALPRRRRVLVFAVIDVVVERPHLARVLVTLIVVHEHHRVVARKVHAA